MVTERRLEGLEFDIGELIARNQRVRGREFGRYDRDPVGFIRDVLGGKPWPRQVEIAKAVRDRSQVTVRKTAGFVSLAPELMGRGFVKHFAGDWSGSPAHSRSLDDLLA